MGGTAVLLAIALTSFLDEVSLMPDVVFTCPEKWTSAEPITLSCKVLINSLNTMCSTKRDTTIFEVIQEKDQRKTTGCTVDSGMYESCTMTPGADTGCGCNKDDKHYTFFYHIVNATAEKFNGDWSCSVSCYNESGLSPLDVTNSRGCSGVVVSGPGNSNSGEGSGLSTLVIVFIVLAIVILAASAIVVVVVCYRREKGPFAKINEKEYEATNPAPV